MKDALLSEHDAFTFVWNRFANTRGKPDSNIPFDQEMEHRIRQCKEFLGRLRANFQPKIAQAYTRALDSLAAVVEDIEKTLQCNVRTTQHFAPNRHDDILSLAKYLESEGVFVRFNNRPSKTGKSFGSLFQVENENKLFRWTRATLKKLQTGTSFRAENENEEDEMGHEDKNEDEDEDENEKGQQQDNEEWDEESVQPDEEYLFPTEQDPNDWVRDIVIPGTLAAMDVNHTGDVEEEEQWADPTHEEPWADHHNDENDGDDDDDDDDTLNLDKLWLRSVEDDPLHTRNENEPFPSSSVRHSIWKKSEEDQAIQ